MYSKILVPLDGSAAGECVVDHVRKLAAPGTEVVLLHIAARPHYDYTVTEPELSACLDDELSVEARAYLDDVAARLAGPGVIVSPCVLTDRGPTGALIADFARAARADLVVLSAHGRPGLLGRFLGSPAEKGAHASGVPVLLIHP
jgi:nucleotide-binding universal stress UspA family protein